jgi:glycosyltransferase involved in cell wall biosynthesis
LFLLDWPKENIRQWAVNPDRRRAGMKELISVVIPNRNGSATIGKCLTAVFASQCDSFEVLVVDDCSEDDSVEIINRFPCRLIRMDRQAGAARARNIGAMNSRGTILFFIDADCLVRKETLARAAQAALLAGPGCVIGGTYTALPHDTDFFSRFQSAFIRYFETRRGQAPDYIASHAMALYSDTFRKSGGFPENFLPIIEDVSFSHGMSRAGYRLAMDPGIEVTHIFNFSLLRSLRNAARKSLYWTMYSLGNRDLCADSGTASRLLKANVAVWFAGAGAAATGIFLHEPSLVATSAAVILPNSVLNRKLINAFREWGGGWFALCAFAYYALLYPIPVAAGGIAGAIRYSFRAILSALTKIRKPAVVQEEIQCRT